MSSVTAVPERRGDLDTETERLGGEVHMEAKAAIGVVYLQAKEHQQLLGNDRS